MQISDLVVPEPLPPGLHSPQTINSPDAKSIINGTMSGKYFCLKGSYSEALSVYSGLKKRIHRQFPARCYKSSRVNRDKFRSAANRLLVEIKNGEPLLDKFPVIPWIREFYPSQERFFLSFPDLLGMNGAWQWYRKGVHYPVLDHPVHPFYGVYFPTRIEHLLLFDSWLKKNRDNFSGAIDTGAGSGVLSFIMAKHGIKKIRATDINPNSIFSIEENLKLLDLKSTIKAHKAHLLDIEESSAGLIVFNPPWIPGESLNLTDKAIYFESGLFDDFFHSAYIKTIPEVRIAIFFSNFAMLAGLLKENPIERELEKNNRFCLIEKIETQVSPPSPKNKNKWLKGIRKREETELWILGKRKQS